MSHRTPGRITDQISSLHSQWRDAPGLPFAERLSAEHVGQVLEEEGVTFRERLYTPLRTLWIFLSQVLSADHSCTEAVARFLAYLLARGEAACAPETGNYCEARQRLPENVCARLVRDTGRQVAEQALSAWRFHGRPVRVVDGSTVSMPDTPANQAAYPQAKTQEPGLGFPIARLVVVFSLAEGRPGRSLSGALARRTRPAHAQTDVADGRAALQNSRDGPQGSVDALAGLQPHPHRHGAGRRAA